MNLALPHFLLVEMTTLQTKEVKAKRKARTEKGRDLEFLTKGNSKHAKSLIKHKGELDAASSALKITCWAGNEGKAVVVSRIMETCK